MNSLRLFLLALVFCTNLAWSDEIGKVGNSGEQHLSMDQNINSAEGKANVALCLNGQGPYSIDNRKKFLSDAIDALRSILSQPLDEKSTSRINSELEKLQLYKAKSDKEPDFWDALSTCPRQLNFPSTKIELSTQGRQEAFDRALSYRNIALCKGEVGSYSIRDRIGYLNAAIQILKALANSGSKVSNQANQELHSLQPTSSKANAPSLEFWDAETTCPK